MKPRAHVLPWLTAALALAAPAVALGHGPCSCLEPAQGPPGTVVQTTSSAFRIVFNPDRADLGIGPERLWREHVDGLAPVVVYRRTWRYSETPLPGGSRFRIPRGASPGRYLVAIFDGSEGGQHFTWEHVTVTAAAAPGRSATSSSARDGGVAVPVVAGIAAVSLALGLLGGWLLRRRLGIDSAG